MRCDSNNRRRWLSRLALGALWIVATGPAVRAQVKTEPRPKVAAPPEKATEPVPRPGNWMSMHERFLERAKQGNIDLLFLGDSITQGWGDEDRRGNGQATWKRFY